MKINRIIKTVFMADFAAGLLIAIKKIFKPKKRAYYCLTWINPGNKDNKINYFFKIKNLNLSEKTE